MRRSWASSFGSSASLRLATIDIGTNTTLLLVVERGADGAVRSLAERAKIARLGRGIGGGAPLGREGIERTLGALRSYADIARQHGAPIVAVGTEALRRAPNAAVLVLRSSRT